MNQFSAAQITTVLKNGEPDLEIKRLHAKIAMAVLSVAPLACSLGWDTVHVAVLYRTEDKDRILSIPYFLLIETLDAVPLGLMAVEEEYDGLIDQHDWVLWYNEQSWEDPVAELYAPVTNYGTVKGVQRVE